MHINFLSKLERMKFISLLKQIQVFQDNRLVPLWINVLCLFSCMNTCVKYKLAHKHTWHRLPGRACGPRADWAVLGTFRRVLAGAVLGYNHPQDVSLHEDLAKREARPFKIGLDCSVSKVKRVTAFIRWIMES